MKSRFEKNEDYDPYDESEVDAGGPDVATAKKSKILILLASAILITVVLYFFLFKGKETAKVETLEKVVPDRSDIAPAPPSDEFKSDFLEESDDDILKKPETPTLPALPKLSEKEDEFSDIFPTFLASNEDEQEPQAPPKIEIPIADNKEQQTPPIFSGPEQQVPANIATQNQQGQQTAQEGQKEREVYKDPRKAPIIVMSSGGASSPELNVGYENNIIILNKNAIDQLEKSQSTIVPTVIADRTITINQGKLLIAVLETAINTEVPGSVRAIVSRDVYAEAGTNILIPRGSRLYGAYSSEIIRGQGRVRIAWTRLIRPDGVDLNIAFEAADQFGRAGIEGDVDNRYGSIIANSLLTSILTVGAAVATEKAANLNSNTTTTASDGSTTTSGSVAGSVLSDVSKSIVDTAQTILDNTLNNGPIIRVPQGTRITIIVNGDMTLPPS